MFPNCVVCNFTWIGLELQPGYSLFLRKRTELTGRNSVVLVGLCALESSVWFFVFRSGLVPYYRDCFGIGWHYTDK